jgi:ATP-dependent Clp protease ATP-binding subunit ClpA
MLPELITFRASQAVAVGISEARGRPDNRPHICDLLVGLAVTKGSLAFLVLLQTAISENMLRVAIMADLQEGGPSSQDLEAEEMARSLVSRAQQLAQQDRDDRVDCDHLLLAVLDYPSDDVQRVLIKLGHECQELRALCELARRQLGDFHDPARRILAPAPVRIDGLTF